MSGGHSGEEIPVPIPNTEVKLSNADDTASRGGKVGSRRAFFLSFYFDGERLFTGVPLFFLTPRSWEESCAAVEGFPARPERAALPRGTERERVLEAQFSDGIRDAAFACRVVES